MKVVHFFIHVFSVLVYLTIGSLLMIMSLRIVSMADVLNAVQEVYGNFWSGFQALVLGCLFICVGLAFAKILIARSRSEDTLVYQSSMGRITVSLSAIEDIARKALKKFLVIKDCKVKTNLEDAELKMILRLTLWSALNIPDLVREVQEEVRQKLARVLGMEYPMEIKAEVVKVEEHKIDEELSDRSKEAVST